MIPVIGDDHRRAILEAVPGVTITPAAWKELEAAIADYERWHRWQLLRDTPSYKAKRDGLWRIAKLNKALADAWHAEKFRGDPLPDQILAVLSEWQQEIERRISGYDDVVQEFSHSQDPGRDFLFWQIMQVWTDELGGKAGRSYSAKHGSTGPLIRFMDAVVRPVLGDKTPTAHTLADIIKRHKAPRRYGGVKRGK